MKLPTEVKVLTINDKNTQGTTIFGLHIGYRPEVGGGAPGEGAQVVVGGAVDVRAAPLVQQAGARAADVAVHAAHAARVPVAH